MKKLTVRKDKECMACLACVQACSEAFYKVMRARAMCTLKALQPVARSLGVPVGQMEMELLNDGEKEES